MTRLSAEYGHLTHSLTTPSPTQRCLTPTSWLHSQNSNRWNESDQLTALCGKYMNSFPFLRSAPTLTIIIIIISFSHIILGTQLSNLSSNTISLHSPSNTIKSTDINTMASITDILSTKHTTLVAQALELAGNPLSSALRSNTFVILGAATEEEARSAVAHADAANAWVQCAFAGQGVSTIRAEFDAKYFDDKAPAPEYKRGKPASKTNTTAHEHPDEGAKKMLHVSSCCTPFPTTWSSRP